MRAKFPAESVRLDSWQRIADNPVSQQTQSIVQESAMRTTDSLTPRTPTTFARRLALSGCVASWILAAAWCQSMGWRGPHLKEVDGATVEDPWTTQAGSEGRAGRPLEKEADPLNLRRFFLSEKAMEIERNCGYE